MESSIALLIPIAGIAMIFGIVYLGVTSDNRRDMAMIEAGMNPMEKSGDKRKNLRNALLFTFVPLGIFVGNYLSQIEALSFLRYANIVTAFLFGGLALLIFHFINKREEEKESKKEQKELKQF